MGAEILFPDLQASVLCEDVRQEVNGLQTLVGVINILPTPALPVALLKLCLWTRWCGGLGKFRQTSRILGVEEVQLMAESHIDFELKEFDGTVTNVNVFAGVQFQQYGLHHVEILLDNELVLRYPVPVVKV
ncbi:MAG TPA: hypothetical protein VGH07_03045 [Chthoniobacterales bacterium]|jgi:hypothetical protein